jgi:hypothetical protein
MDINTVSSAVDLTINALATVGGGAVLAAVLPKPGTNASKAYQIYLIVRKIVDFVGANWFNAKNGE